MLLVYGSTARADLKARPPDGRASRWGRAARCSSRRRTGTPLIAKYAMAARRHMHEYGTTLEQLAGVAVQTRANAAANPDAMYRAPITVDDVLDRADDGRPVHQAALLHPLGRRLRGTARRRGLRPGHRCTTRSGYWAPAST